MTTDPVIAMDRAERVSVSVPYSSRLDYKQLD